MSLILTRTDQFNRNAMGDGCLEAQTRAILHLRKRLSGWQRRTLLTEGFNGAYLEMNENHCLVLGAYSRPDLEIELKGCAFTGFGASALTEILRQNRGPTKLEFCEMDYSVLADGLRGNSRLKSFRQDFIVGNLATAGALRETKGLVNLDLSQDFAMSDETWSAVCDSLKTLPTLEVLNLSRDPPMTPDVIISRIQALVDMLKVNTSIHTIHVNR
jgi:hypothetical protein